MKEVIEFYTNGSDLSFESMPRKIEIKQIFFHLKYFGRVCEEMARYVSRLSEAKNINYKSLSINDTTIRHSSPLLLSTILFGFLTMRSLCVSILSLFALYSLSERLYAYHCLETENLN